MAATIIYYGNGPLHPRGISGNITITVLVILECLRIMSTDLDGFTCKMHLAVRTSGGAAQRITSLAWKRSVGGIVRPSFFAVLRLMTSWNVLGCSTGKSAGFAPFRILAT
jgi:hypothetical protein